MNRRIIDNVPKHLDNKSTRSIVFKQKYIEIPIQYNGLIPYISIIYPTDKDMENMQCFDLTSSDQWESYDENFDIRQIETLD